MDIARFANIFADCAPDYSEFNLSNHLPMAVTALWEMGAQDEQIADWAEAYAKKLRPIKQQPDIEVTAQNRHEYTGQYRYFEPLLRFFKSEHKRLGREALLHIYLDEFAPGIAAAAYHALLRTVYGVMADNDAEIITGLAYWVDTYIPLGPLPAQPPTETLPLPQAFQIISEKIHNGELKFEEAATPSISGKMLLTSRQADFMRAVTGINTDRVNINELSETAIETYTTTGDDIISLHGVTGCHALRKLQPYFKDDESFNTAARYFRQSLCGLFIGLGGPRQAANIPLTSGAPSWPEILTAACRLKDEHSIKMVFSCYEEHQNTGNSLFHQAAAWKAIGETATVENSNT